MTPQKTCKGLAVGDRVSVDFWGNALTGTVERVGRTMGGVIFARMDKSGRLMWFHRESCTLTK